MLVQVFGVRLLQLHFRLVVLWVTPTTLKCCRATATAELGEFGWSIISDSSDSECGSNHSCSDSEDGWNSSDDGFDPALD